MINSSRINTKQKCSVLNFIKKNPDIHLTVGEIVESLIEDGKSVSRATVYRCMKNLLEEGVVRKYQLNKKGSACYQYINKGQSCDMHCHLVCLNCEKIEHFQSEEIVNLRDTLENKQGFSLDIPMTLFYGICKNCKI